MLPIELKRLLEKTMEVTIVQDNAVRPARSVTEDKLKKTRASLGLIILVEE